MTTNFYDKYLLNNTGRTNRVKENTILKDYSTLEYSDYQKLKIAEQYNKLYNEIYKKNNENIISKENEKIYNLSIATLLNNSGKVYIDIINDLSIFFSDQNKEKNINQLGYIFTKNNNILYVGLLILALAFALWLIDITK